MAVSPELVFAITAFTGAAALTSLCVLLALLGTINPYHRPAVPLLGAFIVIALATYATAAAHDVEFGLDALRLTMAEGVLAIIMILPLAFMILTVMLLRASFRKRPEDPLLALLESESGSA